jgi:hypothetical protein
MHVLVFVICLCYSIISPLVLIPGLLYFGAAWIVYKNQLVFVYLKQSESNGKIWVMAFNRTIFGMGLFQFLTAGIFSAKEGMSILNKSSIFCNLVRAFDAHDIFVLQILRKKFWEAPKGTCFRKLQKNDY